MYCHSSLLLSLWPPSLKTVSNLAILYHELRVSLGEAHEPAQYNVSWNSIKLALFAHQGKRPFPSTGMHVLQVEMGTFVLRAVFEEPVLCLAL